MNQVLYWNAVAIEASRRDHSQGYSTGQQAGPTRTSRALAIVHLAIHDAIAFMQEPGAAYLRKVHGHGMFPPSGAQLEDAIDGAAYTALGAMYPLYQQFLDDARGSFAQPGFDFGRDVATAILADRGTDGHNAPEIATSSVDYGRHRPDPFAPTQGLLTPHWGAVRHFVGPRVNLAPFPGQGSVPLLADANYRQDYEEVRDFGALERRMRTPEQTEIGVYWGYDGAQFIGVPPRLYNQIVRTIAAAGPPLSLGQAAELFAEVNVAMADAAIDAWHWKYEYDLWRPVVGIRAEAAPDGDAFWTPLGAPQTNRPGARPATPPFPAYPSGHATFGAALFQVLRLRLGGPAMTLADVLAEESGGASTAGEAFSFVSDELDGRAIDVDGSVRAKRERSYQSFARPVWENAVSRVYLGVHWRFDGLPRPAMAGANVGGVPLGLAVGQQVHDFFADGPSLP